ncbi:MAG: site-specific integrase [bacterium]
MNKERVFEHSRFNNSKNASWIAQDIKKNIDRGSGTADKIITVLAHIHKNEGISVLHRINNDVIDNYKNYIAARQAAGDIVAHTAQGYISALNDVSRYINARTDKDLTILSTKNDLGISNKVVYGGKQTSQELYDKVYAKVSESTQISLELQRNLGLRAIESLCVKLDTVKQALSDIKVSLSGKDQTKNSRGREFTIRFDKQIEVLERAEAFMEKNGWYYMISPDKNKEQGQRDYYKEIRAAGGTKKNNGGNNFSHGNRHYFLSETLFKGLVSQGWKVDDAKMEVNRVAGHGDLRTTAIYLGKIGRAN